MINHPTGWGSRSQGPGLAVAGRGAGVPGPRPRQSDRVSGQGVQVQPAGGL